jgi:hypothetical protein
MTIQYGTTLRNAFANQIEATVGASPKLQLRTGAPPANCAAADSGTLLAELTLPADFLTAASGGAVGKNGTWSGTVSTGGTPGHYRLKDSSGATCHEQGTVGQGTGDLSLNNTTLVASDPITIDTWTRTAGGA